MSEGTGGGTREPDPYRDHDQVWGSVFNDPTAPSWDGPTAPAPTPRTDHAPPAPAQGPPPVPPQHPVPPAPPGTEARHTGEAYRNRGAENQPTGEEHRPTGAAYRNRGAENQPMGEEHRPTGAAYRNRRQPAARQRFPPASPAMSSPYAQPGPVQEHARPQRKNVRSTNTWTVMTILSLLGPLSFSSLVFAFMDLRGRSEASGDSHPLTTVAWVVFTVACVTGTVGFLVHAFFPF